MLLEVRDLKVHYGGIKAVDGIDFDVGEGEIVTLIGSNGAGKSTTLRALSGLVKATGGTALLDGKDLTKLPAHEIVAHGLVQVPEGRHVFPNLTVLENLLLATYTVRDRTVTARNLQRVFVTFPRLKERQGQLAGTLSGGEQQMLALGRALMTQPRIMLLDEPSMGLAPVLVDEIFRVIREMNHHGATILLVEQNAFMALDVAQRGYVMQNGRIVLSGPCSGLVQDPEVQRAYLGR
ncbi:MAG: ABC transporter ATP-binding protein [Bacillota bacterium]|nr:ABC transporter ATP-binding protein [Bacillota bacterium]